MSHVTPCVFRSMKRPLSWTHWLLLACVAVIAAEYTVISWLAPRYVQYAVEHASGGLLSVGAVRLIFPATVTLSQVRSRANSRDAALSLPQMTVRPRWLALGSQTAAFESVDIYAPFARVTRTAEGTVIWPELSGRLTGDAAQSEDRVLRRGWRIAVNSVRVLDGTLEVIDVAAPQPYHAVLQHVSIVAGPLSRPVGGSQATFAIRGQFVGHGGHAAPLYCSGWVDLSARDLQASCRLEPLVLAAFEPYYQQRRMKVRPYGTTLQATSQWTSKNNELDARIQLELGNLVEGDVSIRGTTVLDVQQLVPGELAKLTGEIKITGPLDDPSAWQREFVPGDPQVQELVQLFIERGIDVINIPVGKQTMGVDISPATIEAMSDIQAASEQVEAELEILAVPAEPVPEVVPAEEPGPPAVEPSQEPLPPTASPGASSPAPAP